MFSKTVFVQLTLSCIVYVIVLSIIKVDIEHNTIGFRDAEKGVSLAYVAEPSARNVAWLLYALYAVVLKEKLDNYVSLSNYYKRLTVSNQYIDLKTTLNLILLVVVTCSAIYLFDVPDAFDGIETDVVDEYTVMHIKNNNSFLETIHSKWRWWWWTSKTLEYMYLIYVTTFCVFMMHLTIQCIVCVPYCLLETFITLHALTNDIIYSTGNSGLLKIFKKD